MNLVQEKLLLASLKVDVPEMRARLKYELGWCGRQILSYFCCQPTFYFQWMGSSLDWSGNVSNGAGQE